MLLNRIIQMLAAAFIAGSHKVSVQGLLTVSFTPSQHLPLPCIGAKIQAPTSFSSPLARQFEHHNLLGMRGKGEP